MSPRSMMRSVTPLLLCTLLWACGELTSGGVGEVEVWATADDPQGSSAASSPGPSQAVAPATSSSGPYGTPARASQESAAAGGQLTAQLQAYVRSELTGEWIEMTDGVRDITLELDGSNERRAGVRLLDSGRYTGFRVVFREVEANVTSGLVVGGVPIVGLVTVDIGQGLLTVERDLVLEVDASGGPDIVLDLAASAWLPRLSLATRTVAAADLRNAVGVRLR